MILRWQLDPFLIGTLVTSAVLYGLYIGPLRKYIAPGTKLPWVQAAVFYGGLILLYLAEGSPLHDLGEIYLLSAHMFQHLIIAYIVAPMLIWGMPAWLLEHLLVGHRLEPFIRFWVRPLIAAFTFSFFFSFWHFPFAYDGALQNPWLHHLEHVIFLTISLLVWWPIMSPLEALPRMHDGGRVIYLIALPVVQTAVFALMTFAPQALYSTYENAHLRAFGLTPIADQMWAGVIMKVGGIFAFGGALVWVVLRWAARENQETVYVQPPQANVPK